MVLGHPQMRLPLERSAVRSVSLHLFEVLADPAFLAQSVFLLAIQHCVSHSVFDSCTDAFNKRRALILE